MTADRKVELEVPRANLAAGTCVGEPASEAQQEVRRRRIAELKGQG